MKTQTQQLEITLPPLPCRPPRRWRARRSARAGWWFAQMRRVVDEAREWNRPLPGGDQEQA